MGCMINELNKVEKKRVLIIDDDEDILNWFRMLQKSDTSCSYFFLQDKMDIQRIILEVKPDLIFLEQNHDEKLSEIIRITVPLQVTIIQMSTRDISHQTFMRKPLERKAVQLKIRELLKI